LAEAGLVAEAQAQEGREGKDRVAEDREAGWAAQVLADSAAGDLAAGEGIGLEAGPE
jgi:hypothetical protein